MLSSSTCRLITASTATAASSRVLPSAVSTTTRSIRPSSFCVSNRSSRFLTFSSSASPLTSRFSSHRSGSSSSSSSWAVIASVGAGIAILAAAAPLTVQAEPVPNHNGLSPNEFKKLKLKQIRPYNHNSNIYVFSLDDPNLTPNLPVTSFVVTKFDGPDGKPVIRPYTPIDPDSKGELNLLVKEYPAGVMSKHIANLKPGDELEIKGPLPKFPYTPNQFQHVGFLAGGTGLTPCLQLIESILHNPKDHTKISLVFANTSVKDILLKEQLDSYARRYPSQFRVIYVIDRKEVGWNGEVGFVSPKIIERYMPGPDEAAKVFVCGPPPFYESVSGPKAKDYSQGEVSGHLKTLGYSKDKVFKF